MCFLSVCGELAFDDDGDGQLVAVHRSSFKIPFGVAALTLWSALQVDEHNAQNDQSNAGKLNYGQKFPNKQGAN